MSSFIGSPDTHCNANGSANIQNIMLDISPTDNTIHVTTPIFLSSFVFKRSKQHRLYMVWCGERDVGASNRSCPMKILFLTLSFLATAQAQVLPAFFRSIGLWPEPSKEDSTQYNDPLAALDVTYDEESYVSVESYDEDMLPRDPDEDELTLVMKGLREYDESHLVATLPVDPDDDYEELLTRDPDDYSMEEWIFYRQEREFQEDSRYHGQGEEEAATFQRFRGRPVEPGTEPIDARQFFVPPPASDDQHDDKKQFNFRGRHDEDVHDTDRRIEPEFNRNPYVPPSVDPGFNQPEVRFDDPVPTRHFRVRPGEPGTVELDPILRLDDKLESVQADPVIHLPDPVVDDPVIHLTDPIEPVQDEQPIWLGPEYPHDDRRIEVAGPFDDCFLAFHQWTVKYQKVYNNDAAYNAAHQHFKHTKELVKENNDAYDSGEINFQLTINQFADLDDSARNQAMFGAGHTAIASPATKDIVHEAWTLFHRWTVKHSKLYDAAQKLLDRFKIWQHNNDYINTHNHLEKSYTLAHNHLSDTTQDERLQHLMQFPMPNKSEDTPVATWLEHVDPNIVPDNIDWRDMGAVTNTRNQQKCGSCWSA